MPREQVLAEAARQGATPFDMPGVELGHSGPLCSFDAFLAKYHLDDPALRRMAHIVRGVDTSYPDLADETGGLKAVVLGLNAMTADDHALVEQGRVVFDALYAWCGRPMRSPHGLLGMVTRLFRKG